MPKRPRKPSKLASASRPPSEGAFAAHAKRLAIERTAAVAAAEEAKRRAAEADVRAAKTAEEEEAVGILSRQLLEMMPMLQQFPGLGRAYFDEIKGVAGKRGNSPMPDGAAVKVARNGILDAVADRFDELEGSELVDIDESDKEPLEQWQPTRAEYEFVKRTFFPELFATRPKPVAASTTAPASPDRIEEMARRYAAGEDLYHDQDATPDGKKLEVKKRANGGSKDAGDDGYQVVGWAEDTSPE